jgi:hypothetical protein
MTAERSLEIIRESIERSQRTINKNSAIPLIWWGLCVVVFSLLIAYLWKNHGGPVWNMLWAVLWLIGYAGNWIIDKRRESVPTTFVGKTIGHVWGTMGIFCGSLGLILGLVASGILPTDWIRIGASTSGLASTTVYINLTSIIVLCFGMASAITGFILNNSIIKFCGIFVGIGGFFFALFLGGGAEQLLVITGAAILGLIVPGLLIKMSKE